MEENGEVTCEEEFEEVDGSSCKIEPQDSLNEEDGTAEYLELDFQVESVSDVPEFYSTPLKSRRGRRKKSENKSPSQTSLLKSNYDSTAELKLRPKYRPIRPKPYQPNFVNRNKMLGVPAVNVPALNSQNRFIVTAPLPFKEKTRDTVIPSAPNIKVNNCIKPATNGIVEKSPTGNAATTAATRKDIRTNKTLNKGSKGSIELFFESMAQTVLNLPMQVQAEIKMEICKLVAMAEIKYSSSATKQHYKND